MRALGVTEGVYMTQAMRRRIYKAAGLEIKPAYTNMQLDQRIHNGEPLDYPALIEAHIAKRVTKVLVDDEPTGFSDSDLADD